MEGEVHCRTHEPYPAWCRACIAGRDRANPHAMRNGSEKACPWSESTTGSCGAHQRRMLVTFWKQMTMTMTPHDGVRTSSSVLCGRNSRDGWICCCLLPCKGNRHRHQRDRTEAGIPLVDEHVRQRNGPTVIEGARHFWNMPFVKKFDHLGRRCKIDGEMRSWSEEEIEERHGLAVQGSTLVSQQGSEFGEEKCKNGELCPPCGLARLSDLVLVTGQDEGGQRLGGSDDERDLLLSREEEDWKTFRTRRSGQMRRVWKQLKLLFLTDIFADKMWKATGWVMEDPRVPASAALQAAHSWRSTLRRRNGVARGVRTDPTNTTGWTHLWGHHNGCVVWDTAVSRWVGYRKMGEERGRLSAMPRWMI